MNLDQDISRYRLNFKQYFFPILLQFIITGIMNSTDKLIAAWFIGSKALVATGLTSPLVIFVSAISGMFTSGLGAYLGLMKGRDKLQEANQVLTFILIFMFFFALALSFIVFIWSGFFTNLLGAEKSFYSLTKTYIHYVSFFIFSILLAGVIQSCIMNDESPKYVALSKTVMTVSNVILNIFFVVVLDMGIAGLGLATVFSSFLSLLINIYYLIFKSRSVRLSTPKFDWNIFFKIQYNGLSDLLSLSSLAISIFTINYSFLHFLPHYYFEGYTIAVMFTIFIRHPYMAGSMGIQPVISKEFGAKNYGIVKGQIYYNITRSSVYAVLVYILIIPIIYFVAPSFTDDIHVVYAAYHVYLGLGFSFLFMSVTLQVPSFYTAMGRPIESLVFSVLRSLILVPLLVYTFIMFFHIYGLYIAYLTTDIFLSIIIIIYMRRNKIENLSSVL